MMQANNKLFSYIGFSLKSGKIAIGYEKVIETKKKLFLVIADQTIGRSSKNKIETHCGNLKIPLVYMPENALSELMGGRKIKCVGLTDENLAVAAKKELYKLSEVVIHE